MKKLQLLLTIIFAAICSNAQTKNETFKWLKDKINAYSYKDNDLFDCPSPELPNSTFLWNYKSSCDTIGNITVIQTYSDGINSSSTTIVTGDFNDLINVEIAQDDRCNKSMIHLIFKPGTVWWRNKKDGTIGKSNSIALYLIWNFEDDLQNRMVKAFKHLIDLQKPKEIF